MENKHYPNLIAFAFFAGLFLMVFTTEDSDAAATRLVAYLLLSCVSAIGAIYWDEIKEFVHNRTNPVTKIDAVLSDAEKFSEEFGEVYVMADKLKQKKKAKKGEAVAPKKS
ncbi:hypothetical protein [Rufibacter roseus]|uniref:Uncharacterized protein n=1 Tax=Rufibacter roseus TaxID=1567108 RepID=A0ABW2DRM8_9BACT|nr:hypothetical protein [Rufibacter roseus]